MFCNKKYFIFFDTFLQKLPAIKAELVTLLNEFKARTGNDFLYFGSPLLERMENLKEEHEVMKETQRKVRVSLSFIVLFIICNKSIEFQLYYLKTKVNSCGIGWSENYG